jgi:hypothetical protein
VHLHSIGTWETIHVADPEKLNCKVVCIRVYNPSDKLRSSDSKPQTPMNSFCHHIPPSVPFCMHCQFRACLIGFRIHYLALLSHTGFRYSPFPPKTLIGNLQSKKGEIIDWIKGIKRRESFADLFFSPVTVSVSLVVNTGTLPVLVPTRGS